MNRGSLIIVSGPSGSGKDTVLKEVLKKMPDLDFSISSITRDMRVGEVEGEKYNFISRETFEKMIADNALLEYNVYCGNYYGTPNEFIKETTNNGDNVIAVLEINGAINAKRIFSNAITIFIMPPSFDELERRLRGRKSEDDNIISERLNIAKEEIKYKDKYDYVVINNTVDEAVLEIENIINNC